MQLLHFLLELTLSLPHEAYFNISSFYVATGTPRLDSSGFMTANHKSPRIGFLNEWRPEHAATAPQALGY